MAFGYVTVVPFVMTGVVAVIVLVGGISATSFAATICISRQESEHTSSALSGRTTSFALASARGTLSAYPGPTRVEPLGGRGRLYTSSTAPFSITI